MPSDNRKRMAVLFQAGFTRKHNTQPAGENMNKLVKASAVLIMAFLALQLSARASVAAPAHIEDSWLELSFDPPEAWKLIMPEGFQFSLLENDPAYIFQKGNSTILIIYQQAEGLGLEEASTWMHDSASENGKVYELLYKNVNGRAVSEFMVSGRGDKVGSVSSLQKKQVDNVLATVINGEWLIRIVYSSPDYTKDLTAFDRFIESFEFKGKAHPGDASIATDNREYKVDRVPPQADPYLQSEPKIGACASKTLMKIKAPQDATTTKNSETNLKVEINDIDEVRISINGEEVALLSGSESPIYRKVLLENGPNKITVTGTDICGTDHRESVTVTREARN